MDMFDKEFSRSRRTFGVIAVVNLVFGIGVTAGIIAFLVWLVKYLVATFA